ncbi:DUF4224 domain-containing protein [Glaciecola siphonariae]|uniref:DUF4224 domain-containing protein n=1 Tax=Glaciecola siphonariae TaxID=521012 RepID=A0ABV9LTQ9_9ALTE
MKILKGEDIAIMTGYSKTAYQQKWFNEKGYTYQINGKGELWTTDDWMNGKDKYASNDDGFNMEFLEDAS